MKILKGLLLFFLFSVVSNVSVKAQDIHFTQFYLSPLTTNPAYTGAFQGTFRVGGIYRDQWGSISTSAYRTPSFYIDAPIFMLGKRALHLSMDKKSNSVLTIGVQAGYTSRDINTSEALFQDAINEGTGVGTSIDLGGISGGQMADFSSNSFDMNIGLLLKSKLNDNMRLELGTSLNHILTPDTHLNEGADSTGTSPSAAGRDAYDLPGNFIMHGQFFVDLTDKFVLKPAFFFQSLSGANEISLQALAGYHLDAKKEMTLNFGLGYRMRDATKFIVGMDYKQFRAGVAYDLTVSDLADAGTPQGFELGVSYIAKIYKKPTVKPVIFCPRF